ncbi:MAG: DUF58 domain-containing protein [Candidatus Omnitrophica bacterium]|nr:DUF58 domain-containing protein [Candidatus Omnitrophota bacterium]
MIPKDLFKKIRRIEISTQRLVTDVFAGQYHSVFKGQGIEFDEVREYQMGDDVRTIDWNVTARTGQVHVKKFIEERELTVMIMVDASRSTFFGSVNASKHQLAAEISCLLALSAIRNNDKVGLIIFSDRIEKFIAPRKGRRHVLRIVREVLYFKPEGRNTDIIGALDYLNKVTTRRTITFLISDFFDQENTAKGQLKKILSVANKRHDMTAITLNDPREEHLPACGLLTLEDAETGQMMTIDTSNHALRQQYEERNKARLNERRQMFRSIGVDSVDISTDSSYADEMAKFFIKRKRRRYV